MIRIFFFFPFFYLFLFIFPINVKAVILDNNYPNCLVGQCTTQKPYDSCNNGPSNTNSGGCGTPCEIGSPWEKYNVECKDTSDPKDMLQDCKWVWVLSGQVCSTGNKCLDPGTSTTLNSGTCECPDATHTGYGGQNNTCCSNTTLAACTQYATQDNFPPPEGVCPQGTETVPCNRGGDSPACGQAACDTLKPPPPPCNTGIECGIACTAPPNTCGKNNGHESDCWFKTYNYTQTECIPDKVADQPCTKDMCDYNIQVCSNSTCVSKACSVSVTNFDQTTASVKVTDTTQNLYDQTIWTINGTTLSPGNDTTYNFKDLTPFTQYTVNATRRKSTNSSLSADCGSVTFTTTSQLTPPPPACTVSVNRNSVTSTTASISTTATNCTDTTTNWTSTPTISGLSSTHAPSYTTANLTPGTSYTVGATRCGVTCTQATFRTNSDVWRGECNGPTKFVITQGTRGVLTHARRDDTSELIWQGVAAGSEAASNIPIPANVNFTWYYEQASCPPGQQGDMAGSCKVLQPGLCRPDYIGAPPPPPPPKLGDAVGMNMSIRYPDGTAYDGFGLSGGILPIRVAGLDAAADGACPEAGTPASPGNAVANLDGDSWTITEPFCKPYHYENCNSRTYRASGYSNFNLSFTPGNPEWGEELASFGAPNQTCYLRYSGPKFPDGFQVSVAGDPATSQGTTISNNSFIDCNTHRNYYPDSCFVNGPNPPWQPPTLLTFAGWYPTSIVTVAPNVTLNVTAETGGNVRYDSISGCTGSASCLSGANTSSTCTTSCFKNSANPKSPTITTITLTASGYNTTDAAFAFDGWSTTPGSGPDAGCDSVDGDKCTVRMLSNKSIIAKFKPIDPRDVFFCIPAANSRCSKIQTSGGDIYAGTGINTCTSSSTPAQYTCADVYLDLDGDRHASPTLRNFCPYDSQNNKCLALTDVYEATGDQIGFQTTPGDDCNDNDARAHPEDPLNPPIPYYSTPMNSPPPEVNQLYDYDCNSSTQKGKPGTTEAMTGSYSGFGSYNDTAAFNSTFYVPAYYESSMQRDGDAIHQPVTWSSPTYTTGDACPGWVQNTCGADARINCKYSYYDWNSNWDGHCADSIMTTGGINSSCGDERGLCGCTQIQVGCK